MKKKVILVAFTGLIIVLITFEKKEHVVSTPQMLNKVSVHKKDASADFVQRFVTPFVQLDDECKAALNQLQMQRKGKWHLKELNLPDDNEQYFIPQIASMFVAQHEKSDFSQEEEWDRMMAIDYLGEKWIGRVSTYSNDQIKQIFISILKSDISMLSDRKKKSLIGDKVEVMQYLARGDQDFARLWLESQKSSSEYRYLKVGFENGLAFQKYP